MFPTEHPPYIGGFEILGEIGRGGMGVVYRAHDPALQRELAIKLQIGNWEEHPDEMERFLRESRILAKINHPNVVQIYSVGTHEGAPFFAMELLERSVAESARLRMPNIAQLKRWMLDAARGLSAIHEMGVVHRDIKPANLLLTTPTSVESEHVKIADLGIASANDLFGGRLTQSGMVLGTTGYLAPEAWFPDTVLDGRADQYALGVVYFELLTGRSPHQFNSDAEALSVMMAPPDAPDVRAYRADIDQATAELIARMLSTKPNDRFPSSPELVQAMMATMAVGSADYRIPTPRPVVAAKPNHVETRPRVHEGPTLARRGKPANSRGRNWLAILLPTILVLPALSWYFFSSARKLERPASEPERAAVIVGGEQSTPITPPPARSAWAEYLLGHYSLGTETMQAPWTLSLLENKNGELRAELSGVEPDPLKLRGEVVTQIDEVRGDSTWTVSRVHLTGKGNLEMVLHVAFDADHTEGSALFKRGDQTVRLQIVDSDDL